MPKEWKVLDAGCGGLDGENTSDFLVKHFGEENITGICKAETEAKRYLELHPKLDMRIEQFFTSPLDKQFDLLVLDLNIEGNLRNWSSEGLREIQKYLKKGSYVTNYVMTTDQYGDPEETPKLLREHCEKWWGSFKPEDIGKRLNSLSGFKLVAHEVEERRPYITWVLLKYE